MTSAALQHTELLPAPAIREAKQSDNRDLLALAASCSMRGDITLRFQREPDFFALNRLEGREWTVDVVVAEDRIAGCVATSIRDVYIDGCPMRTGYVGDLKVHPAHRDIATADALWNRASDRMDCLPTGTPTLITVLAGNKAMARRLSGERGLTPFDWVATIRSYSIPILWRRHLAGGIAVERAKWFQLDEMANLWNRVARTRQFAPVFSTETFADWIRSAPGLGISSYILARSQRGELLGFIGLWDQSSFKQMYVEKYSRKMAIVSAMTNAIAPRLGGARLAQAGEQMRFQTVVNACVAAENPEVLKALLRCAHNSLRNSESAFFNIGLDVADPLTSAVEGLFAQATDIDAYVGTTKGPLDIERLRARPLHYEIALV